MTSKWRLCPEGIAPTQTTCMLIVILKRKRTTYFVLKGGEKKKSLKETRCGAFSFYQIRVNHSSGVAKELNVDISQEC